MYPIYILVYLIMINDFSYSFSFLLSLEIKIVQFLIYYIRSRGLISFGFQRFKYEHNLHILF